MYRYLSSFWRVMTRQVSDAPRWRAYLARFMLGGWFIWAGWWYLAPHKPPPDPAPINEMWEELAQKRQGRLIELSNENAILKADAKKRLGPNDVELLGLHVFQLEGVDWDIEAFKELVWRESRYSPTDQNPESTAFGLGQFLDSTWGPTGIAKCLSPTLQLRATVRYIRGRFSNARSAKAFHDRNNYY